MDEFESVRFTIGRFYRGTANDRLAEYLGLANMPAMPPVTVHLFRDALDPEAIYEYTARDHRDGHRWLPEA